MSKALIVNLYAGPGTGKSTTAAAAFALLKIAGIKAEYVSEFAKDLTWEERHHALTCQPYVTGKQLMRLARVESKVEVAISDSPLLLGLVYKGRHQPPSFTPFLLDVDAGFHSLNVFLKRDVSVHPYVEVGRNQNLEEAIQKDQEIYAMLTRYGIPFIELPVEEGLGTAQKLVEIVKTKLGKT